MNLKILVFCRLTLWIHLMNFCCGALWFSVCLRIAVVITACALLDRAYPRAKFF